MPGKQESPISTTTDARVVIADSNAWTIRQETRGIPISENGD
jgi:hypothetical protein